MAMWNVYKLSLKLKTRPSDLLGLRGSYERFCIDEVVVEWGVYVDSELGKIRHKKEKVEEGQRLTRLRQLLSDTPVVKKYATPIATR